MLSAILYAGHRSRLCIKPGHDHAIEAIHIGLSEALLAHAYRVDASSIHILFAASEAQDGLNNLGLSHAAVHSTTGLIKTLPALMIFSIALVRRRT